MRQVKQWCRFQWQRREARCWVRANGADVATYAMFHLNHLAGRGTTGRKTIYGLKTKLIRYLYEAGYCVSVSMKLQQMMCHSCAGSGEHYKGGHCWKCGGSGVWREHKLYEFMFMVDGQHYIWHQPQILVDWPVVVNKDERGVYARRTGNGIEMVGHELKLLYLATVYEFLEIHEVDDLPALPSLWQAIWSDWCNSHLRKHWWRLKRTRRNWKSILRNLVETYSRPGEGDLVLSPVEGNLIRVSEVWYASSVDRYKIRGRYVDDGRIGTFFADEVSLFHPLRRRVRKHREIILAALGPEDEIPF